MSHRMTERDLEGSTTDEPKNFQDQTECWNKSLSKEHHSNWGKMDK